MADHAMWLALDVPGDDRSLGSILATGTAGPLRSGYGAPRDHVLGLTLVTGDGRILRVGGRVVKNVAGYEVAKLALGTFGAFGVVTSVHLRLRAVPRGPPAPMHRPARRPARCRACRPAGGADPGLTRAAVPGGFGGG